MQGLLWVESGEIVLLETEKAVHQELTSLQILFLYVFWFLASKVSQFLEVLTTILGSDDLGKQFQKFDVNFLNTSLFNWNVYVSSGFSSLYESFTPFSLFLFFSIAFHGYCSNKGIQIIDSTLQFFDDLKTVDLIC